MKSAATPSAATTPIDAARERPTSNTSLPTFSPADAAGFFAAQIAEQAGREGRPLAPLGAVPAAPLLAPPPAGDATEPSPAELIAPPSVAVELLRRAFDRQLAAAESPGAAADLRAQWLAATAALPPESPLAAAARVRLDPLLRRDAWHAVRVWLGLGVALTALLVLASTFARHRHYGHLGSGVLYALAALLIYLIARRL